MASAGATQPRVDWRDCPDLQRAFFSRNINDGIAREARKKKSVITEPEMSAQSNFRSWFPLLLKMSAKPDGVRPQIECRANATLDSQRPFLPATQCVSEGVVVGVGSFFQAVQLTANRTPIVSGLKKTPDPLA